MNTNSSPSTLRQLDAEPGVGRCPLSENSNNENRAPPLLPIALTNMLKNTTENGDVGQFAIRPARVPQAPRPHRRTAEIYYGSTLQWPDRGFNFAAKTPIVDDRKQLPSYSRDTTSEIISMYEATSQKSPRRPQFQLGPDNRSYSMTQASHLPYNLSNHRSYASLRSQPELNLVPRPRSPFPYPARLKRLGFRPTSPILAVGRTPDSSVIADIQQTPNGYGGTRSTSPSIYVHKRVHATLRRSNATKSNPSLPGHSPTSQRSSLSPRRSSIGSIQNWSNRAEKATKMASPTHSMLSADSATNIFQPHISPSIGTPIGKHALLPLFYDYTEGFDTEEAPRELDSAHEKAPPPSFLVERTIHEDRKLSSESFTRRPTMKAESEDVSKSSSEEIRIPIDNSRVESKEDHMGGVTNVTQDIIPLYLDRCSYDHMLSTVTQNIVLSKPNSSNIIANEISSSELSRSDIMSVPIYSIKQKLSNASENFRQIEDCIPSNDNNHDDVGETDSPPDKRSSVRLSSLLPRFPNPPNLYGRVDGGIITTAHGQQISSNRANLYSRDLERPKDASNEAPVLISRSSSFDEHISSTSGQTQQDVAGVNLQSLPSSERNNIRLSRFHSIGHGSTDLAQLIANFKIEYGSHQPHVILSDPPSLQDLPALPAVRRRQSSLLMDSRTAPKDSHSEGDLRTQMLKAERLGPRIYLEELLTISKTNEEVDRLPGLANNTHHFAMEPFLRSGPPVLAPKPISPARALKLKNSIPQLMKALPPVPQDIPSHFSPQEHSLSYKAPSGAFLFPREVDPQATEKSRPQNIELVQTFLMSVPQDQASYQVAQSHPIATPSHKFELKSKFSLKNRFPLPPSSWPWNLEENYPWAGQQSDIRLPPAIPKTQNLQSRSRFKERPTETPEDLSGTVQIKSDAKRFKTMIDFDLRHPKDLFTPPTNLNDVFRQVSRQFSSGSASASVQAASTEPSVTSPLPTYPISPTEARSFFSDSSSRVRSHNSLRNRISNLRARLPHPYLLRSVTQTNRFENAIQLNGRPILTGTAYGLHDDYGIPLAESRHQDLKSKVSGWLKDARAAMGWCGETHSDDEARCFAIHK